MIANRMLAALLLSGLLVLPAGRAAAHPLYYTFEGTVTYASGSSAVGIGTGDTVTYVFRIDDDPSSVSTSTGRGTNSSGGWFSRPVSFWERRVDRSLFDVSYVGGDFLAGYPPPAPDPTRPLPAFGDGTTAEHSYGVTTTYAAVATSCYWMFCSYGRGDPLSQTIDVNFLLEHLSGQGALSITAASSYTFSPTGPTGYASDEHHPASWTIGDVFQGLQRYYYDFMWVDPYWVYQCVETNSVGICTDFDYVMYGNRWSYETGTIRSVLTLVGISDANPLAGGSGGGSSGSAPHAVPEPAAAMLVLAGVAALGGFRLRRRSSKLIR